MIFSLLRAKQWVKNLLIFAAPLGAGYSVNSNNAWTSFVSFVIFSLAASSIYVLNDWHDRVDDFRHPSKQFRPIASGRFPHQLAIPLSLSLFLISQLICFKFSFEAFKILLFYVFLNLLYTFWLKNIPVLDLGVVASGYSIRILFGSAIFNVTASSWLMVSTFCAAFGIVAAKRKSELDSKTKELQGKRKVLEGYSSLGLHSAVTLALGTSFTTYSLWLFENSASNQILSLLCQILGLVLTVQLLMKSDSGTLESPEDLVTERKFIAIFFVFGLANLMVLYF
jgi:decaprenyl-phosphate phosphoribosyltransferase